MILNSSKTKVMLVTTYQKRQRLTNDQFDLTYNKESLNMISNDKILGVFVDNNLTWSNHIKHLTKKNASSIWFCQKLKKSCLKLTEFSSTNPIFNHILTFVTLYGVTLQRSIS